MMSPVSKTQQLIVTSPVRSLLGYPSLPFPAYKLTRETFCDTSVKAWGRQGKAEGCHSTVPWDYGMVVAVTMCQRAL